MKLIVATCLFKIKMLILIFDINNQKSTWELCKMPINIWNIDIISYVLLFFNIFSEKSVFCRTNQAARSCLPEPKLPKALKFDIVNTKVRLIIRRNKVCTWRHTTSQKEAVCLFMRRRTGGRLKIAIFSLQVCVCTASTNLICTKAVRKWGAEWKKTSQY